MTKLSDLKIDEVSLVRKGANQHAHVAIAKSAEGEPGGIVEEFYDADGNAVDVDELEHGDIVLDAEGNAFQVDDGDEDVEKGVKDVLSHLNQGGRAVGGAARSAGRRGKAKVKQEAAFATYSRPAGAARNARGAARNYGDNFAGNVGDAAGRAKTRGFYGAQDAAGRVGSAGSAVGGFASQNRVALAASGLGAAGGYAGGRNDGRRVRKSFAEEVEVELSKALTDDDRDAVISKAFGYMEELEDVAKAAQEMAQAEHDARMDQEFLEVAKSYELPIDDEDLADTLRAIAEALDPEQIEVVRKCLELASISGFDEFGKSGGGDNNDIMTMVESASADVFSKSARGSVSKEQIVGDAFAANPELYDQYLLG